MSELQVTGLSAGYGHDVVLTGVDLVVQEGSTVAILGASGSGKTTLLRVVAGFVRPRAGEVNIGGIVVAGTAVSVPPERRGVGYVRQEGSLFPHLSVAGNIAFGLPWPRGRHRQRVLELLDLVELPAETADRKPAELSGGQQQRVALARALAPRPKLVLLDEPFSSLDTALRKSTRDATARALRATGATAVLVTHDQGEALSFADEVVILAGGSVRQVGLPHLVYRQPADAEVARFLGDANLIEGAVTAGRVLCELGVLRVTGNVEDGVVEVLIRPEQIVLGTAGSGERDAVVTEVTYYGHDAVVELRPAGESDTTTRWQARIAGLDPPSVGERVGLSVLGPVRVFPRASGNAAVDSLH